MTDELLPYYNEELKFLRLMGAEFADKYPKIAGRLRLGASGSHDPHVERIIEAFAYLNARIQCKLDDDFPEIVESLLGVLYPHYQNPMPSMAIVQFLLDRPQAVRTKPHQVRKHTMLETELVGGEPCRYQTCYPASAWPFQVTSASLVGSPFQAPPTRKSSQAAGVLRIELRSLDKGLPFSTMEIDTLRFYLHAGQSGNAYELYETLFNNTIEIALASSVRDTGAQVLPKSSLEPVGFSRDEGMVPYSARSFPGYRLLSEYFAFPEKFLFCDLKGLTPQRLSRFGNQLEIYVYLDRVAPKLENKITEDNIRLGCTPVVNLFAQRADAFKLTQRETEYRIIPDSRRNSSLEIYSIDRVEAVSPRDESQEYVPFYSLKHAAGAQSQQTFWYASRKPATGRKGALDQNGGTEMYLSLVDLGFDPAARADWTVIAETTCFNRDLPRRLPFGGGRPRFDLVEGKGLISSVKCLTKPTPTLRPVLGHGQRWRLMSHLSLNHLSIVSGAEALREILKLYNLTDDDATRNMIEAVLRVESQRDVGRLAGAPGGVCQGRNVKIHFDEEKFSGSGLYLFASVLDRFLGLYVSINSFSKLEATTEQRINQGTIWTWPARPGEKTLL